MTDPVTQDPAVQQTPAAIPPSWNQPLDFDTPLPKTTAPPDLPSVTEPPPPSGWDQFVHGMWEGTQALYRGPANAIAAGANLTNSAFRLLPGVNENTPGFGRVPAHPLGTSDNIGAGIVEGITQFATGYALTGPITRMAGAGTSVLARSTAPGAALIRGSGNLTLIGNEVAGAASSFIAFDADSGRMADMLAQIPGVGDFMRAHTSGLLTDEQDSELIGRAKNALDGAGFGAATHGILSFAKWLAVGRREVAAGRPPAEPPPDLKKWLSDMEDMRPAEQSPFKGPLIDEAMAKAIKSPGESIWMNVDGSEIPQFPRSLDVPPESPTLFPAERTPVKASEPIAVDPLTVTPDVRFAGEPAQTGPLLPHDPLAVTAPRFPDAPAAIAPLSPDPKSVKPDVKFPTEVPTSPPIAGITVPPSQLLALPTPEIRTLLKQNIAHEAAVAADVLGRELKFDEKAVANYVDLLRRSRQGTNIERAGAQRQIDGLLLRVSSRGRKKLSAVAPSGHATEDLMTTLQVKIDEGSLASPRVGKIGFRLGQQQVRGDIEGNIATGRAQLTRQPYVPLAVKDFGTVIDKAELTAWVNQHGTLLDNPQTTIHIQDGTASIGVSLRADQLTPEVEKIAESLDATPPLTPLELGLAAENMTSLRLQTRSAGWMAPEGQGPPNAAPMWKGGPAVESQLPNDPFQSQGGSVGLRSPGGGPQPKPPRAGEPPPGTPPKQPASPGGVGGAPPPVPVNTPHQVYLGQIGFDNKTADEIGRILGGEFEEGMAVRGEIALKFKARADATHGPSQPYTDAVNPKRMSRQELFSRELRRKGLNLEGLKGQPEQLAQAMRVLEKMNDALREAENPLLVHESYAEMNARVQVETDTMLGIASASDLSTYIKLNEKAGVEAANKIGAQARAAVDIAAGIIDDVRVKSVEFIKREESGGIVDEIEWADLAENRNLASDAASMGINLKNALARNLYMQRGKIVPSNNVTRYTSAQIRANPELRAKILMDNGGVKGMREFAEAAAKIDAAGGLDLSTIAALLKLSKDSAGGMGIIQTGWFASILSSLGTPVAQITGNMSTALYQPFLRAFSMARAVPFAKTPELAALYKAEMADAVGTYTSMFAALPESLRAYKYGFLEGRKLTPNAGVWDVSARAKQPLHTLTGKTGKLADGIGYAVSIFGGRLLRAGDEATRVMVYRGVARQKLISMGLEQGKTGADLGVYVHDSMDKLIHDGQALGVDQLERRALKQVQAQGYTGPHAREKVARLVNEWQSSDWYKELSPLSEFAIAQGEEAAMSKGLDPRTVSGGFNQVVNRHPGLKFVTPFIPTSVNIASFGMQHLDWPHAAQWLANTKLPKTLGFFGKEGSEYAKSTNRFLSDMGSGDPLRQASAKGRIVMGSAAATGIAGLYMAGMVTGSGPSDAATRQKMHDDNGWLPYSFKIGDRYYSYRRLDPLATVIGTVADIAQAAHLAPDDKQADLSELGKGVVVSLANNLTNKTYLRGLSDFVEAIVSPQDNFERYAKSLAATVVPNIVRDVANVTEDLAGDEPAMREIRTVFDAIKAKIPGVSRTLEPRRNMLGEPIKRTKRAGEDWLGPVATMTSIMQVGDESGNALNHELAALEGMIGKPGSKRGDYDMVDIKSGSGQSAYDRWLENSSTLKRGGMTLRQSLERMVDSDAYKRMSPEAMNGDPSQRASELNSIIQRYRREAFRRTRREIKELNQAELAGSGITIGARQ